MIAVRIHAGKEDMLLAACDEDLIGREFREGKMRLRVSGEFYMGELITEEMLAERMRSASIFNLVGERTVAVAVEQGLVDSDCIIVIDGIKHAQAVKL
ncbi:MAG: DUF424 family protein [Thermoplasmatales archaeon]|jgi:hypothetical protein|nr:DUF424 family protein [Thermoplasmatales archaeon]